MDDAVEVYETMIDAVSETTGILREAVAAVADEITQHLAQGLVSVPDMIDATRRA